MAGGIKNFVTVCKFTRTETGPFEYGIKITRSDNNESTVLDRYGEYVPSYKRRLLEDEPYAGCFVAYMPY